MLVNVPRLTWVSKTNADHSIQKIYFYFEVLKLFYSCDSTYFVRHLFSNQFQHSQWMLVRNVHHFQDNKNFNIVNVLFIQSLQILSEVYRSCYVYPKQTLNQCKISRRAMSNCYLWLQYSTTFKVFPRIQSS